MPFELQQVRRRISAVRQIRKVTSAMQRMAAARLVHDRLALEDSRRYGERLADVLRDVFAEAAARDHALLRPAPGASAVAVVVFGGDRGLCGGFHSHLVGRLDSLAGESRPSTVEVVAVGRIINRRARRLHLEVALHVQQPVRARRAPAVEQIAALLSDGFRSGRYAACRLLYTRFASPLRQTVAVETVLPAERPAPAAQASRWPVFEPSAGELLDRLLPEVVRQAVDHALLNAAASENAARQTAMARATENAGEMLKSLTMEYRRLRQEHITTEMLELAGGMAGGPARNAG